MFPLSVTILEPLRLPVEVIEVDGLPKVLAGGLPVTPINIALKWKVENRGSTKASIETYTRAARLYVEFAARRERNLIDVTNEEFKWFVQGLLGRPFLDAQGRPQTLSGARGERTSDLMIALLYSLGAEIQELYGVQFDWYKYRALPAELIQLIRGISGPFGPVCARREHAVPYTPRKVLPLPDDEFVLMLQAAYDRWGAEIADGDAAFAEDRESQRGALFYRNTAILLTLGFAGARRSESPQIRPEDIDQENGRLYLVTKGRRGARLPVLLHPLVHGAAWTYATGYRPVTPENSGVGYPLFVSHGTANYGRRIGPQCVRKIIDSLRGALTPPWDRLVSPHTLRHRFSVHLQKSGAGATAVTVNMRHVSQASLYSYAGSPEIFADQLLGPVNDRLVRLLKEYKVVREAGA